ncbi:hypothetical protein L1987_70433 [Smallanthus sonchifolius]|uniref:Uncharacterized protein n=1 Tax=Smallanthus sonchifolius TaxID=185202 RepID=A0ACB9ANU2_9ASTR|nr:hypothetical protein L1987_70433 [Smallanthus sonchifolius]
MGIDKYNVECRSIVTRYVEEWEKVITRTGRWVDFKNDYKTMDLDFMESVWCGGCLQSCIRRTLFTEASRLVGTHNANTKKMKDVYSSTSQNTLLSLRSSSSMCDDTCVAVGGDVRRGKLWWRLAETPLSTAVVVAVSDRSGGSG